MVLLRRFRLSFSCRLFFDVRDEHRLQCETLVARQVTTPGIMQEWARIVIGKQSGHRTGSDGDGGPG